MAPKGGTLGSLLNSADYGSLSRPLQRDKRRNFRGQLLASVRGEKIYEKPDIAGANEEPSKTS